MWGFSLNIRVSIVAPRRISHPNLDTLPSIEGRNRRFLHGCSRWSKIRLHGIDTPERKQPFGTRARQFASELTFQQTVTVRVRDTDRYGRLVAKVILPDGRSLNRELVTAGMAWWYRQYAKDDTTLAKLEAEARSAKRGLWSDPHAVAPWTWRKQGKR